MANNITLPKNAAIKFGTNFVTDHNRQPIDVSVERIEKATRMANGTMRKYVVADKRTWTVSWNNVPGPAAKTVDSKWGADDVESFYNTTKGAFTLTVTTVTGTQTFSAMFDNFSKTLSMRGAYDMYDLSVTLIEV